MSYQAAAALQGAVYGRLTGFPALADAIIVDGMPAGPLPRCFVLIGPEVVIDQSDASGAGAEHRFDVAVITSEPGFLAAKELAGAVSDALTATPLTLAGADLVSIRFLRATARRRNDGVTRRIDMTFRARIAF